MLPFSTLLYFVREVNKYQIISAWQKMPGEMDYSLQFNFVYVKLFDHAIFWFGIRIEAEFHSLVATHRSPPEEGEDNMIMIFTMTLSLWINVLNVYLENLFPSIVILPC